MTPKLSGGPLLQCWRSLEPELQILIRLVCHLVVAALLIIHFPLIPLYLVNHIHLLFMFSLVHWQLTLVLMASAVVTLLRAAPESGS
jgi:hypothetical protein